MRSPTSICPLDEALQVSSPRRRGPTRRGRADWHNGRRLPLQHDPVVMGPCLRRTTGAAVPSRSHRRVPAVRQRGFCPGNSTPRKIKGRRECRASHAPAASHAKGKSVRALVTAGPPKRSGIPRAIVLTAYSALSLVSRAFLPPSPADHPASLISASGYQDHATSPFAHLPFVIEQVQHHRIPLSRP